MNFKEENMQAEKWEMITLLPPAIIQTFNRALLLDYDRWKTTNQSIEMWREAAKKKYKVGGRRMSKFEELIEVFKELYGWQKAEGTYIEQEREKPKTHMAQRPAVPVEAIHRLRGQLGKDVRCAFGSISDTANIKQWRNSKI